MARREPAPPVIMRRFVRRGDSLDLLRLGIYLPQLVGQRHKQLHAKLDAILTILNPPQAGEFDQEHDLGKC